MLFQNCTVLLYYRVRSIAQNKEKVHIYMYVSNLNNSEQLFEMVTVLLNVTFNHVFSSILCSISINGRRINYSLHSTPEEEIYPTLDGEIVLVIG